MEGSVGAWHSGVVRQLETLGPEGQWRKLWARTIMPAQRITLMPAQHITHLVPHCSGRLTLRSSARVVYADGGRCHRGRGAEPGGIAKHTA
eukprot:SAG11_NODE_138_length_15111_cov_11.388289_9_plen_91_part_00